MSSPAEQVPARVRLVRNISIGVCVVLMAGFVAYITGRAIGQPSKPATYGSPTLPIRSAAPDFAPLDRNNQIPSDVIDVLPIPSNARVVARHNFDRGVDTYNRSVTYTSPSSPSALERFFPAALADDQWRVNRTGSLTLALHASNDGDYWELGITIAALPHHTGSRFGYDLLLYDTGE